MAMATMALAVLAVDGSILHVAAQTEAGSTQTRKEGFELPITQAASANQNVANNDGWIFLAREESGKVKRIIPCQRFLLLLFTWISQIGLLFSYEKPEE